MKKLLILGGSDLQVSIIKLAAKMGIYVITCDYLPDNPGHKFANEYHNISTTDKDKVLNLAQSSGIDGILAYASDPAATVAAWVAERLDLPTNSLYAVNALSRKDLFRDFMRKNNFLTPRAASFSNFELANCFFLNLDKEAIIKPVDSSGSKGVFRLKKGELNKELFEKSLAFSKAQLIIIEEFIEKSGYQIGGDGFLVDGKLVFRCFGDIHFSKSNPLLPCAVSVPSLHSKRIQDKVHGELQRLLSAIGMCSGGLNFDILIDDEENVHILEIGPRNGGNMLPELIEYCTGVDMKVYAIKAALGENCSDLKMTHEKNFYSHYVIHSSQDGVVASFNKSIKLKNNLLYEHYNFKIGDKISKFVNSSNRLGILLLKYKSKEEMLDFIYNMDQNFQIKFYEN
ncbi:MAG: ATP-grasp domain-containing protein [Flavobacteriaceae bacterium]|nr:ATP-grasp domain-containing protein [Flavobacteriaceae bacterium]